MRRNSPFFIYTKMVGFIIYPKVRENGLLLSVGLVSRIVAKSGQGVPYAGGGVSKDTFHQQPDAAAVFGVSAGENKGG